MNAKVEKRVDNCFPSYEMKPGVKKKKKISKVVKILFVSGFLFYAPPPLHSGQCKKGKTHFFVGGGLIADYGVILSWRLAFRIKLRGHKGRKAKISVYVESMMVGGHG